MRTLVLTLVFALSSGMGNAQDKLQQITRALKDFDSQLEPYWHTPEKYIIEREDLRWEILREIYEIHKEYPDMELPGGVNFADGVVTVASTTAPELISLPIRLFDITITLNREYVADPEDPWSIELSQTLRERLLAAGMRPLDVQRLMTHTKGEKGFEPALLKSEAQFREDQGKRRMTDEETRATLIYIKERIPANWMSGILEQLSQPSAMALIRFITSDLSNGIIHQDFYIGGHL